MSSRQTAILKNDPAMAAMGLQPLIGQGVKASHVRNSVQNHETWQGRRRPTKCSRMMITYHFRWAVVNQKGTDVCKVGAGKANRIGNNRWRMTIIIGLLPNAFYVRLQPSRF
jgi:hypothetical protein